MLTRKHFEAAAAILREVRQNQPPTVAIALSWIELGLGNWFTVENPNFDYVRFHKAAYPEKP